MAQTNDSLAVETPLDSIQTQNIKIQEVKISENETFIYQKPKFWDIVNKIPKNIAGTATDIVSKKYYPYGLAALGRRSEAKGSESVSCLWWIVMSSESRKNSVESATPIPIAVVIDLGSNVI